MTDSVARLQEGLHQLQQQVIQQLLTDAGTLVLVLAGFWAVVLLLLIYGRPLLKMIFWLGLCLLVGVVLAGCTHWRHAPPVPLEQHKADLRDCLGVARGLPPTVVVSVGLPAPVATAVTSLSVAATVVEEFQFEARLSTCMGARGYQRDGFTTSLYGWTAED